MQTIDEISIGRDGDMFTLTIYHYNGELSKYALQSTRTTFLIGLPDQLHAEVQRTIGAWLTPAVGERQQTHVEDADGSLVHVTFEPCTCDRPFMPGEPVPSPGWGERFARAHRYDPDLARDMERGK